MKNNTKKTKGPCGLAVSMQEVVGANPTEGKTYFSRVTLFIMECEELFCKTNIKLTKSIKINNKKTDHQNNDIQFMGLF